MTKDQLISTIATQTGETKRAVTNVFDVLKDFVEDELVAHGEFSLLGLGKLKVKTVAERKGRNPSTGEEVTIPEHRKVGFSPSKSLKDALN